MSARCSVATSVAPRARDGGGSGRLRRRAAGAARSGPSAGGGGSGEHGLAARPLDDAREAAAALRWAAGG